MNGNIFFLFLTCSLSCTLGFTLGPSGIVYKTKYFDASLDHFNFITNATFKLRYLINDTFWNPGAGAPIFFYTGNEGDVETFCNNTGFMWEIAPDFNALLVFAEHRYYGKSLPFGNKSFSEPQYSGFLSSSQALADYIDLIDYIKETYNVTKNNNPVIAFGGSYGGMLTAWIRMKYPGSIAGAIAASAPIWQFTDMTPCYAFNRVTSSVYNTTSHECYLSIKKSWGALEKLSATADGLTWLSSTFKTCNPLKTKDEAVELKNWLIDIYTNLAMGNYPYPADFIADLPAHPVKELCNSLKDSNQNDKILLQNIFQGISLYFNYTGTAKCLDLESEFDTGIDDKGWSYQSCTEMVMPMCDDGVSDMFPSSIWNITSISNDCFENFGVRPQVDLVKKLYGGKHISSASNIIFSNGLLDPWSSGGVLKNMSKSVLAVIIPEGAHHLDLRFSNSADPVSVRIARYYYKDHIKRWIKQYHSYHHNYFFKSRSENSIKKAINVPLSYIR